MTDAVVAKRVWRAMQLLDAERSVLAIPFLIDPYEGTEEPEEETDDTVTMVKFTFSPEDYEILKSLQVKQTEDEQARLMKIGQMFLEKKVSDLLADILADYMETGLDESYQITEPLKLRANEILQTDWRTYD